MPIGLDDLRLDMAGAAFAVTGLGLAGFGRPEIAAGNP